jgi:hypothetical protein
MKPNHFDTLLKMAMRSSGYKSTKIGKHSKFGKLKWPTGKKLKG